MSSPISLGSFTPAASQATAGTEYSPENLQFHSLSIFDGKAIARPSSKPKPLQTLEPSHFEAPHDFIRATPSNGHRSAFNSSHSSLSSDPFFAAKEKAELSTCFLYIVGDQEIFDYHNDGRFSFVLKLASFGGIHTRSKGKEVFLYYKDRRDAETALQFFVQLFRGASASRTGVDVMSITGAEFCYSTRDTHKPKELVDLGRTFETGNDGKMIFVTQPPNGMQVNERVQAYAEDKLKALIEPIADVHRMAVTSVDLVAHTVTFLVELFEPFRADEIVLLFRNLQETEIIESMRVRCSLLGEESLGRALHGSPSKAHGRNEVRDGPQARYFDAETDDIMDSTTVAGCPVFGVIGDKRPAPFTGQRDTFHYHTDSRDRFGFDNDYKLGIGSRRENKNFIDLNRVKHGLDVRTTVMLRNIPNRITHKMLKEVLDEYVWGSYDFMYLRIDFTNNCNVGYAFINFVHPKDVATFVEAVAGKKWKYSDKVAEVSYATMQGRETLVHKFRNSSVMNEGTESRPKLYKTLPDVDAGVEEAFPGPDNLFKLARSNQNAAHIGLFSPNRGGPGHLGDRHRHGRFDRGTSFALLERMMAENAMLRGIHGLPPHQNIPYY